MTSFFRPYGEVRIRNQAGDEWFLSSRETPFLTSINMIIKKKMVTSFSFGLEAPFAEGIALLESGMFTQGNQIGARIGYADGGATPWFYGKFTSGGDGLVINMDGLSGQVSCLTFSEGVLHDIPAAELKGAGPERILQLVAEYIGAELILSSNLNERFVEMSLDPLWVAGPTPDTRNAWDWLKYVCSASMLNAEFDMVFDHNGQRVLFVGTNEDVSSGVYGDLIGNIYAQDVQEQARRITYEMRGLLKPTEGIYPLITWGPEEGLAQWDMMPEADSGGVKTDYIDESTGEVVSIDANPYGQEKAVAVALENPGPEDQENDGVVMGKSTSDGRSPSRLSVPGGEGAGGEAATKRKAQSKQGEGNEAQKATISSLGVPNEFPGNLCNVRGCSKRYDGVYEVWEVSHQWSGSDWNMSLTVVRQGVGETGSEKPQEVPASGTMPEDE